MKSSKKTIAVIAVTLLLAVALFVGAGAAADGPVAKIDGKEYADLQTALNEAADGKTVQLIADITYDNCSTTPLTIVANDVDRNFTLDLNGHTITAKLNNNASIRVLEIGMNNASKIVNLTIKDSQASNLADPATGNGAIIAKPSNESDPWNVSVSTITLHEHGNLTIESGKIITEGRDKTPNAGCPYAIDIILNGGSSDAILTVNGGYIESKSDTGMAIRANCNSKNCFARVTVNGGKIVGDERGIWMQWASENVSRGEFTINGGKVTADRALELGDFDTTTPTADAIKGFIVKIADSDALVCNDIGERPTYPGFEKLTASSYPGMYRAETETTGVFDHVEVIFPVAKIGETEYFSLAEAVAAVPAGTETTITMIADHTIIGNAGVPIPAEKNIILDLNGCTILCNATEIGTSAVIRNDGTLTIGDSTADSTGVGDGLIVNGFIAPATPDYSQSPGYASNVITNCGTLTVLSGTISNVGDGSACYALDANSTSSSVNTEIAGGKLIAVKTAVRMFCNSPDKENNMTVYGGLISSESGYGLIFQSPNVNQNNGSLDIKGGTFSTSRSDYPLDVYVYAPENGDTAGMSVNITNGKFNETVAFSGSITSGVAAVSGGHFNCIESYASTLTKFITGGIFDTKPDASYIADGYEWNEGAHAVAKVGPDPQGGVVTPEDEEKKVPGAPEGTEIEKISGLPTDGDKAITKVTYSVSKDPAPPTVAKATLSSIDITVYKSDGTAEHGNLGQPVTVTFTIPDNGYDLSKLAVYHNKGENNWVKVANPKFEKIAAAGTVPAMITVTFTTDSFSTFAVVEKAAEKKSSSSSQGSSVWLTDDTPAQPTATPTPTPVPVETPGVKPVTPTETPAKTPAPLAGILAGLGAAAVLFGLRRK